MNLVTKLNSIVTLLFVCSCAATTFGGQEPHNSAYTVNVRSYEAIISYQSTSDLIAECQPGELLLGGGFKFDVNPLSLPNFLGDNPGFSVNIAANRPINVSPGSFGWMVRAELPMRSDGTPVITFPQKIIVEAYCLTAMPTLGVTSRIVESHYSEIPFYLDPNMPGKYPANAGVTKAECAPGEFILAGGYEVDTKLLVRAQNQQNWADAHGIKRYRQSEPVHANLAGHNSLVLSSNPYPLTSAQPNSDDAKNEIMWWEVQHLDPAGSNATTGPNAQIRVFALCGNNAFEPPSIREFEIGRTSVYRGQAMYSARLMCPPNNIATGGGVSFVNEGGISGAGGRKIEWLFTNKKQFDGGNHDDLNTWSLQAFGGVPYNTELSIAPRVVCLSPPYGPFFVRIIVPAPKESQIGVNRFDLNRAWADLTLKVRSFDSNGVDLPNVYSQQGQSWPNIEYSWTWIPNGPSGGSVLTNEPEIEISLEGTRCGIKRYTILVQARSYSVPTVFPADRRDIIVYDLC